jgi:hypothetical protein
VVAIHFDRGLPREGRATRTARSWRETCSDHTITKSITIYIGLDVHKDSITAAGCGCWLWRMVHGPFIRPPVWKGQSRIGAWRLLGRKRAVARLLKKAWVLWCGWNVGRSAGLVQGLRIFWP